MISDIALESTLIWCMIWGAPTWDFKGTYLHLLLRTKLFSCLWCKFADSNCFVPKIMHQNLAVILRQFYYGKKLTVLVPRTKTTLSKIWLWHWPLGQFQDKLCFYVRANFLLQIYAWDDQATLIGHKVDCTQEHHLFISMKHTHLPPL